MSPPPGADLFGEGGSGVSADSVALRAATRRPSATTPAEASRCGGCGVGVLGLGCICVSSAAGLGEDGRLFLAGCRRRSPFDITAQRPQQL
jgi:hypothetical protein